MKLIDKDALVAEIEKLKGKVDDDDDDSYYNGWKQALRMLELSLNTLEVNINIDEPDPKADIKAKRIEDCNLSVRTTNTCKSCKRRYDDAHLSFPDCWDGHKEENKRRGTGCKYYVFDENIL